MRSSIYFIMVSLMTAILPTICNAQNKQTAGVMSSVSNMLYVEGDGSVESFFISSRPVTNREYILYLDWTERIYNGFPFKLFDAWPGSLPSTVTKSQEKKRISELIPESEDFVKEYVFNPKYLDFPIIGITWEQANEFCFWLTDRYNEYSLIEAGIMLWDDAGQAGGECFVTESYIADQYFGLMNEDYYTKNNIEIGGGLGWTEFNYSPSFRLPSKQEFSAAHRDVKAATDLHAPLLNEFKYKKKDFINQWWKIYNLVPSDQGITINYRFGEPQVIPFEETSNEFPLYKYYPEWCLDSRIPSEKIRIDEIYNEYGMNTEMLTSTEQLSQAGDIKKDHLGHMPYRILNVKDGIPVILRTDTKPSYKNENIFLYNLKNKAVVSDNYDRVFTCFRYAVSARQ